MAPATPAAWFSGYRLAGIDMRIRRSQKFVILETCRWTLCQYPAEMSRVAAQAALLISIVCEQAPSLRRFYLLAYILEQTMPALVTLDEVAIRNRSEDQQGRRATNGQTIKTASGGGAQMVPRQGFDPARANSYSLAGCIHTEIRPRGTLSWTWDCGSSSRATPTCLPPSCLIILFRAQANY